MITLSDNIYASVPLPEDAKMINLVLDTNNIIVESIDQYLERVDMLSRHLRMVVTILSPPGVYEANSFVTKVNNKEITACKYWFKDGIKDDSFIFYRDEFSPTWAMLPDKPNLEKAFTDLTDVIPEDYIGKDMNVPIVNEELKKVDLIETEELETTVAKTTLLADMPQTLSGYAGYSLRVKMDESGWEFYLP